MEKPWFKMAKVKDGGYLVSYMTSTDKYAETWFSNPPSSIDHVCIVYLRSRLWNVTRDSQVKFIKRRFKEEAEKLGIKD